MQIEIKLENGRTLEEELEVLGKLIDQTISDNKFLESTLHAQARSISELEKINNEYLRQITELQTEAIKDNRSLFQKLFSKEDKKSRLTKTTINLENENGSK
jgi:hypothetical protein